MFDFSNLFWFAVGAQAAQDDARAKATADHKKPQEQKKKALTPWQKELYDGLNSLLEAKKRISELGGAVNAIDDRSVSCERAQKGGNMRFFKNGELQDREIVAALQQAAKDYENGEIAEVRDLLADIVNAIDDFEDECEA